MSYRQNLSVVIATLGGESLIPTIESLNQGSIKPNEILVCAPEMEAATITTFNYDNVRVLASPHRGQVSQRAFGFLRASNEYVLQIDDDMSVDYYCVEHLLATSELLGPNVAVAPALIDLHTGRSVYEMRSGSKFFLAIYFWLMNGSKGYQPGKIDKAGCAVGVDPATAASRFVEVEWLAGGCMLHRRENLVLEDFWERPGKAYCEDVVHSYILKQRGIRLFVDILAQCELEVQRQASFSFRVFLSDFYRDFCARRYYMKRLGKSSVRLYLFYSIRFARYVWSRLH